MMLPVWLPFRFYGMFHRLAQVERQLSPAQSRPVLLVNTPPSATPPAFDTAGALLILRRRGTC